MIAGLLKKFVNSTISEPNALALNEMARNRVVIETNMVWIPPVTGVVYVSAISAGGDGSTPTGTTITIPGVQGSLYIAGNGGAAGNYIARFPILVSKGHNIACIVGTGDTEFGSYFTLVKGENASKTSPGISSNWVEGSSGMGGYKALSSSQGGVPGTQGLDSISLLGLPGGKGGVGGSYTTPTQTYHYSLGGGGGCGVPLIFCKNPVGDISVDGRGGNGGNGGTSGAAQAGGNGSTWGAGGGGGGMYMPGTPGNYGASYGAGGKGANGVVIIKW